MWNVWKSETDPEAIFILPRDTRAPRPNYTLDFLYDGQTTFHYLLLDEATVRQTLTSKLWNYRTVHLITRLKGGRERVQHRATGDALLPLLFEKYGQLIGAEKTKAYTIQTYRLDSSQVDFEAHLRADVPSDFKSLSLIIADQLKLAGIKQRQEDNNLFIGLAGWQGWAKASKIVADYTVFVQLLDDNGQRVTGVDVLPENGFTRLDRQEVMVTHYTISLSEVRPGPYTLLVGLYYFAGDELVRVGSVTLDEPIVMK